MALELSPEEGSWEVTDQGAEPGVLWNTSVPHGLAGGTGSVMRKSLSAWGAVC